MATALRRAPAPLALMGLIFFLSAQPDLDTGLGAWDTIARKLAHAAIYCALTLLWAWTLSAPACAPLAAAAGISLLYAVSDEWHQTFVAGRVGSPLDVAIDAVGIAVAVLSLRRAAARTA